MIFDVMAGRPAKSPAPPFGQRVAAFRKERGLSQAQLAELLGVSRELVDYYERRAKNPSLEIVQRVSNALGVSPADLLEEQPPLSATRKKPGPASKIEERIERIRRLPRRQQEFIIRMIDAAIESATSQR